MYKYLQRQLKHYFDDLAFLNRVPGALGREQAAYMQGQILLTSRQIFSTHKRINKSVSKRQLSDKVGRWFLLILQDASLDRQTVVQHGVKDEKHAGEKANRGYILDMQGSSCLYTRYENLLPNSIDTYSLDGIHTNVITSKFASIQAKSTVYFPKS